MPTIDELKSELDSLKKEVIWCKRGLVATGKLAVKTDDNCEQIRSAKRFVMFANGEEKDKLNMKWKISKKGRDEAMEKNKIEEERKEAGEDVKMEGNTNAGSPEKKPHWGTEIFLFLLAFLKGMVKSWEAPESGKNQIMVSGLQTTLSEIYEKDPSRIIRFANPHTEEPETSSSWPWTLQFYDNPSADFVRECLLFELQPLMRRQLVSVKQDTPKQESQAQAGGARVCRPAETQGSGEEDAKARSRTGDSSQELLSAGNSTPWNHRCITCAADIGTLFTMCNNCYRKGLHVDRGESLLLEEEIEGEDENCRSSLTNLDNASPVKQHPIRHRPQRFAPKPPDSPPGPGQADLRGREGVRTFFQPLESTAVLQRGVPVSA